MSSVQQDRENRELRARLAEAEEALAAIRDGRVDAIVVHGPTGPQVFSLSGAETIYRRIIETMGEAAVSTSTDGKILFCNLRFAEFVGASMSDILGRNLFQFVAEEDHAALRSMLHQCVSQRCKVRLVFCGQQGVRIPALLFGNAVEVDQGLSTRNPNAEGDSLSLCLVAADLTELENSTRIQAELRASEERLRNRNQQLALLARVSQLLIFNEQSESELLDKVFSEVAAAIGAELYFHYQSRDEASMQLCNWSGLTDDERKLFDTMRYGELLCGRVAVQRRPIVVEDIAHNEVEGSAAVRAAGCGAYAGFPLLAGDRLLGTVAFITRTKTHFAEGEEQTIQTACDQVAAMLERMRLTRELRDSEERQRLAIEGAGLGTWDVDMQTGEAVWNRRHYELQGYGLEITASLEHWQQRIHPADAVRVMIEMEYARQARAPVSLEHRLLRADTGEVRWLSVYGCFTYDAAGHAVRLSGVSQDVTDRKQAEQAGRQSETFIRGVLDSLPEHVAVLNTDGVILHVNESWERFARANDGNELAAVPIGINYLDLFQVNAALEDPHAREARTQLQALLAGRINSCAVEYPCDAPGQPRWFLMNGRRANNGTRNVVISHVDITANKLAEEALRNSEAFARRISEIAPNVVYIYDINEKRNVWGNRGLFDELGYTQEQLDSMSGNLLETLMHPDDFASFPAHQAKLLDLQDGETADLEYRMRRADQSWVTFLSRDMVFRRDSNGRVTQVIGAALDITDRKQAELALREADRRKNEFLATLAHELRNPLATIRSGLEVLKLARGDPKLEAETREMMERQFMHLVALVDDLLEISRISQGKLKLRSKVVSITEAIHSAIETCRPSIEEAKHHLLIDLPARAMHVQGDPHRLSQLFANLISNASKYTPPSGSIEIMAQLEGEDVIVAVRDTGIGITEDQLSFVFEMFAQVDREGSGGYNGLGIGLPLVKSLVELHGGSITASSGGQGAGSTFTVRLPLIQHPLQPDDTDRPRPEPMQNALRRVLVVDDNVGAAKLLAIVVKMLGHEVQVASNGQEAVERGRAFEPEIVIMDIGMPVMDGYQAARAIRGEAWGKGIILIALTGWGQDDDKQKTREAGFDRHLVKPVEPDTIRTILAELAPSQSISDST